MKELEKDKLEKVEQLVEKAGCTYADAKDALEKCEWNLLDAIIALEESGKAVKSSARYQQSFYADDPEVIRGEAAERIKPEGFRDAKRGSYGQGNFADDSRYYRRQAADSAKGFFAKAKAVLTLNHMTIFARGGNEIICLPLWAVLILLLLGFWFFIIAALCMMAFGCRFHFEGRDFGKTRVNDAFDKATEVAYNAGQRVKEEFKAKPHDGYYDGEQNTDH